MSRNYRALTPNPGLSVRRRHFKSVTPAPSYADLTQQYSCPSDLSGCVAQGGDQDYDGCFKEAGDSYNTCGSYSDAMVCEQGYSDVTCFGEVFRGCRYGQSDTDPDNDYCCAGYWDGMPHDNIDHASCYGGDAGWGQSCYWQDDPNCYSGDVPWY